MSFEPQHSCERKIGLYFPFLGDRAEVQKRSKLSRAPVYHEQCGLEHELWNILCAGAASLNRLLPCTLAVLWGRNQWHFFQSSV